MPILYRNVRDELKKHIGDVGKDSSGEYKKTPPNAVGRKLLKYPKLPVSKITVIADTKKNILRFKGVVSSETTGNKYKVNIEFHSMKFQTVKSDAFPSKVEDRKGNVFYYKSPSLRLKAMKFRCHCPDWRHRFETPMHKVDALVGGPRKYKRETPPWKADGTGGRPYANSTDTLGICKHLSSFLWHLRKKKQVRE